MEIFSVLLVLYEKNPPIIGRFPSPKPVTQSFDVFFDVRLHKRLSKQSGRRWFEMSFRSLCLTVITVLRNIEGLFDRNICKRCGPVCYYDQW